MSNIVNQGNDPREAVGTVNTAEFFVAFCSTLVFLVFVVVESWQVVFGLIAGGLLAAPLGALLVRKISAKALMFLVGITIILSQTYTLYTWLF
nr:TSUP family transporter [Haliscomenobacter sp.]